MKLNCKPGDLAVVVRSTAGNEGKFCTVLRLATASERYQAQFLSGEPMWVTDVQFMSTWGDFCALMFDAYLSPIHDNDGEDETLQWVPRKVAA